MAHLKTWLSDDCRRVSLAADELSLACLCAKVFE